ncbi:MAG TPA: glycosyltransferase [Candidatus Limnocylindrales bacterium]|nr:glycosyltransferase [Candidatus Limnocylindrales bacterium]
MRIAFVAPLGAPLCDTTSRGSHVIVADLARAMKERGHDVMVFCAQGSYLKGVDTAPIIADARSTPIEELSWHMDRWDPDVISQHASDAEAFGQSYGHPVVHTLHANPDESMSAAVACDATLVAVSRDSHDRWRSAGRDVATIGHGIPEFHADACDPEPFAVIAGRVTPEKGTAAAIRAARAAGLEPVVVGEVYDRGYFAREIVPLLDGVRVFRTLPRERVFALMSRAAVTMMPVDWEEPFGLVAAEAQLAGCPVVGYARGALPEVVHDREGGVLVSGGDEDALAVAIPVARTMCRKTVRAQARDRFDFTAMLDQYEALLAHAATGAQQARAA